MYHSDDFLYSEIMLLDWAADKGEEPNNYEFTIIQKLQCIQRNKPIYYRVTHNIF